MKNFTLTTILISFFFFHSSFAKSNCTGKMINPVTDICWDCIFPISIGDVKMNEKSHERPDTKNPKSPICICPNSKLGGVPTPGLAIGFWEPVIMADVTKRPFCMVNIGGIDLDVKTSSLGHGSAPYEGEEEGRIGNWQVHWYSNPLIKLLSLIVDGLCSDISGFDLLHMTELDPLWQNDELSFIINPEAILFGNILAQSACVADCIAATARTALDPLFWCAGCQGTMYPMNGNIAEHYTSIQSSSLAVERLNFKLHRQMLSFITSGERAVCSPYMFPIIKKSQYRLQTTFPVVGQGKYGCNPYGRTTMLHEAFKEKPIKGEDFGYFVWRKRNCCIQ